MRKDVKIGLVLSLVVVLIAGWYYLNRGGQKERIPLGVELASSKNSPGGGGPEAKSAAPAKPKSEPRRTDSAEPRRSGGTPADGEASRSRSSMDRREDSTGGANQAGAGVPNAGNPSRTDIEPVSDPTAPPGVGAPAADAAGDRAGSPATDFVASDDPGQADGPAENPLAALLRRGRDTVGALPDDSGADSAKDHTAGGAPSSPSEVDSSGRTPGASPAERSSAHPGAPAGTVGTPGASLSGTAPGRPAAARTHTVAEGDSLSILAEIYYGSQRYTKFLLSANPQVKDADHLLVGTVLQIPPLESKPSPQPSAAEPAVPAGSYRVKAGDSFYGIARDVLGSASRWKELFELNRELVNGEPENLRVGQVLKLPGAPGTTTGDTAGTGSSRG